MWFLGSFTATCIIAIISLLFGNALLTVLYRSHPPRTLEIQICSLLVGTGTFTLLFGMASYLGFSGKFTGPTLLALALILTIYFSTKASFFRNKIDFYYYALPGLCIISALIFLQTLLFFHAFDPYSDAFVYLSVSDYLQQFPFLQPANPNPYKPMLAAVLLHQVTHLRMGANFFLAFVQSIMPVTRSYEIYPAVIAWGLMLNISAIYLACRWMICLPRFFALGAAILATFLLSPLYFAANTGFLPMLYASAFLTYLLSISAYYLRKNSLYPKNFFALWIQIALGLSFVISIYSELFPVAFLILSGAFLLKLIRTKEKLQWIMIGVAIFLMTGLFANIEIYRMPLALMIQLKALVGWNIPYSIAQFWEAAIGIMPMQDLPDTPLYGIGTRTYTAIAITFGLIFLLGLSNFVRKRFLRDPIWVLSILLYTLMFICFALFFKNPWLPEHLGQTWNMFKITNWAYPVVLIGIVLGIYTLPKRKYILTILVIIGSILSLKAHYMAAEAATVGIRSSTYSDYPFEAYTQLAEMIKNSQKTSLAELQPNSNSPELGRYTRNRQLLAYFLYPYPVASDWRTDGTIGSNMSHPDMTHSDLSIKNNQLILVLQPRSPDMPITAILPGGWYIKKD